MQKDAPTVMSEKIKAIQTFYKGYHFRSRLEARWAVFFDALGLKWDYEPEGFELPGGVRYLPDFFVHSANPRHRAGSGYWIEIKGAQPTPAETSSLHLVCRASEHNGYLFTGPPGGGVPYVVAHRHSDKTKVVPDLLREWETVEAWGATNCCEYWFGLEHPWRNANGLLGCAVVEAAAAKARRARFEFGQSGAN